MGNIIKQIRSWSERLPLFLFELVNGDAELTASMLDGLLHQRLALRTRHIGDKFTDRNTQSV